MHVQVILVKTIDLVTIMEIHSTVSVEMVSLDQLVPQQADKFQFDFITFYFHFNKKEKLIHIHVIPKEINKKKTTQNFFSFFP